MKLEKILGISKKGSDIKDRDLNRGLISDELTLRKWRDEPIKGATKEQISYLWGFIGTEEYKINYEPRKTNLSSGISEISYITFLGFPVYRSKKN